MACEVPVAAVVGASLMQTLDALKYQFNRCLHAFRTKYLDNFTVDLFNGERLIDVPYVIFRQGRFLAFSVNIVDQVLSSQLSGAFIPSTLLGGTACKVQFDGGTESTELLQS